MNMNTLNFTDLIHGDPSNILLSCSHLKFADYFAPFKIASFPTQNDKVSVKYNFNVITRSC